MIKIILGLVAIGALIGVASTLPSMKGGSKDIYAYVEYGTASVKETEGGTYSPLSEKKQRVKNGSYVKTEKGIVHIVFPNNSVTSLGEQSEMKVEYVDSSISILQIMGDTYHRVTTLASGKTYEVKTPGTLAAVRGTKFAVSYNANAKKTKVAVTENTVSVSRPQATTTEPTAVSVGSLASVNENLPLSAKNALSVGLTKNDQSIKLWLDRNTLLDQYLGTTPSEFLTAFVAVSGDSSNLKNLRDRLEKTKTSLSAPAPTEKKDDGTSKKGTLKSLLSLGVSQQCSYTFTENNVTSKATIYLAKGMMRIDGTTVTSKASQAFHAILSNKTMYAWGDGMPQGIRMTIPDGNTQAPSQTGGSAQMVDLNKEMNYSCSSWSADTSYFTPPSTIEFMDMSQMINQASPTGATAGTVDVRAAQCGACDSLSEPQKSQCKQALGCR
jgi:hypothetical protein